MMPLKFAFITIKKRSFSIFNFFISIRKGGETVLKNDIKYVYIRDLINYEKERKEKYPNEKKVKHLIKITKVNGGTQLKCSMSFIYLLTLKCKYIESIWLNIAKNTPCASLTCLETTLKNIEWYKFIKPNYLKNVPLKITSIKSKLFDISSIRDVIYKYINSLDNSHENNSESNSIGENKSKLENVWNLLAIHIENNICNVDLKFSGKLSPRFYEYGYIKELDHVQNFEKYQNFNFFSLFNNNYKIKDEKMKNIVNDNVPFWSISEEKKKIIIDHENIEKGEQLNFYKYSFFSDQFNSQYFQNKSIEANHNVTSFSVSKEKEYITNDQPKKSIFNYNNTSTENVNYMRKNQNSIEKLSCNSVINNIENKIEKCENIKGNANNNHIISYLNDMEIKRMNYYNNNFFLSDDCYDTASCIYSLIIHKCLKNIKNVNIIWDPFCSNGNIIFELVYYLLNIPLYNENEILPFMNLKIFNHNEFSNIYNFVMNNLNSKFNNNVQLIGTDSRSIMISQCKKNLVRYKLYYKDILNKVKNKKDSPDIKGENNAVHSSNIKRNSFLKNVLKDDLGEECEESEYLDEKFFEEDFDVNIGKDMDKMLLRMDNIKEQIYCKKNEKEQKNIELFHNRKAQTDDLKISAPGVDTISLSTEEDKEYNLEFPFDISFHKAHFFNVAPFIKNAIIITKIPHFSFSKELGINKKTFTLFEQFDHMLSSKNDWKGVYVLVRNKAFLNKSKLEWNKILLINDSKGRDLTLLSWTGRRKTLYSMSAEDDKLKELEKFSNQLKFDF
ncbi:conserved Plasmodium protein, unknown function [Plasmodium berghei]|uniref:Methyltransferase n=2 Tax=Plasmodium berghei TaxID=5821 RepID=A0A509AQU6_PLABA|nr:conserved protein, unknown function [Plasmodium berghei ANKA]CXJ22941.1 conserved Plasmodium protein, unknown function [Plasmodium berghei]SCM26695.1 conserved Plasmodium protein, unknown function [Plasmodium berghei]SCN28589.1 conserved Plasmodium protein, unknown function [Plasmodium berghei]SCO62777.1 conserved Plasmodium protein, unknown function [Plasmodium berghei]SCO64337.1 conserved Plasmodium protein, unknown function [Plasmodium berghei]|eukprot:XP_034424233.1 conserved protein, unknown function [Plasmodium berghei ANKA]